MSITVIGADDANDTGGCLISPQNTMETVEAPQSFFSTATQSLSLGATLQNCLLGNLALFYVFYINTFNKYRCGISY